MCLPQKGEKTETATEGGKGEGADLVLYEFGGPVIFKLHLKYL